MQEKRYKKGEIIKQRDKGFREIFVIISGKLGVFVFPNGHKTLMTELKSREVVGEYNMSFIWSKASEYEVTESLRVLWFDREEYERIMFQMKRNKYNENNQYFKSFPPFNRLNNNKMKKLCANTKEKIYAKNEKVTLNGWKVDWLYLVKSGTFRAEKEVIIEHENLWPAGSKLWKSAKIKRKVLFTAWIIHPFTYFGENELLNNKDHKWTIVANTEGACLMFIEKDKFEEVMELNSLITEASIIFPTEEQIIQRIQVIERSLHMK